MAFTGTKIDSTFLHIFLGLFEIVVRLCTRYMGWKDMHHRQTFKVVVRSSIHDTGAGRICKEDWLLRKRAHEYCMG